MFAINENTKKVIGKEISTYSREIYNCNILEVEAGTTGYMGGDICAAEILHSEVGTATVSGIAAHISGGSGFDFQNVAVVDLS